MTAMELHRHGEEMAANAVKKFFPGRIKHSMFNQLYCIYRGGMDIAALLFKTILDTGRAGEIIETDGAVILIKEQLTDNAFQIYKDQKPDRCSPEKFKEFWEDSIFSGFEQFENELNWCIAHKFFEQTA